MMRQRFLTELEEFRTGFLEMGSLVLSQVERAVFAWEEHDQRTATDVIAVDESVDERCLDLDHRIFNLHLHDAPVASDLRLLHVGLIAVVALERVGDLAVAVARIAETVEPDGADAGMQTLIRRISARAVDGLAQSIQAVARSDVDLGEQAVHESTVVRSMLDELLVAARSATPEDAESRAWVASAVLVGRHLERVSNNGRELGGRVRFLVTGEPFRRGTARRAEA